MPSTLPAPAVDSDERHRRLTIACPLLDRLSDDLEQLANDRALADEQRATANAALMLAFVVREELDPMAA
jgi:hypothetical protein